MREAQIERALVRAVKDAGGLVRKVQWIGRVGAPDRLVLLPDGRAVWVELKAPGRKPTVRQAREHSLLKRYGLSVAVVDSMEAVHALVGRGEVASGTDSGT